MPLQSHILLCHSVISLYNKQAWCIHDSNPEICKSQNKTKRPRSIGKENACQGDNIPPPKHGRKNKSIDNEHRCGPCTVWLQTGSNEK